MLPAVSFTLAKGCAKTVAESHNWQTTDLKRWMRETNVHSSTEQCQKRGSQQEPSLGKQWVSPTVKQRLICSRVRQTPAIKPREELNRRSANSVAKGQSK